MGKENPGRCWYDSEGGRRELNGRSHSEFAFELLTGIGAIKDSDNPGDPKHSNSLREMGWIQASVIGDKLFIIAKSMDSVRLAWKDVSSVGSSFGSVIFAIGRSGSGVTVGLNGSDMALPLDTVIQKIAEAARGGSSEIWPPRFHGNDHGHGNFE